MRTEIRIAGFGGQGVGLVGQILGKALALYDEMETVMTQAYGPEARGGASSADVVVSDREIAYPFIQNPDILIALSQEAYTKFHPTVKAEALIIIDEDLVTPQSNANLYLIPATRLAEDMGRRIIANMIVLGFFTSVTGVVTRQAAEEAIKTTVKAKTVPLNLEAFAKGYAHHTVRIEDMT